jgi:hypothetical protein
MQDMELLEGESDKYGEPFLGGLLKGVGGMLGLGEGEEEGWGETPLGEGPYGETPYGEGFGDQEDFLGLLGEGEEEGFGDQEQFFGKALKALASKALPLIRSVAQKAAPLVAKAVAGPLGGPIGSIVSGVLGGQGEGEEEGFGDQFDQEDEGYFEGETESVLEAPMNETQAIGEMMAAIASQAATDTEAEAQIGGAIAISLSPEERRALRDVLPAITRGAAILTRILRRHPATRRAVPAIVPIVKRTAVVVKNRRAAGAPVTKKTVANTMARQTKKVLGNPRTCTQALQRNARAAKAAVNRSRSRQSFSY